MTKVPDSPVDAAALLHGLPDAIVVLDERGIITWVNDAWRRFAQDNGGDHPTTEGVGLDYLAVGASDASARAALAGIEDVLAGRRRTADHCYRCNAPGQLRRFRMHVERAPWAGPTGRAGAVVVHRDVTELEIAEERFAVQRAVAQALAAGTPVLEVCRILAEEVCRRLEWDAWDLWGSDGPAAPRLLDVRAMGDVDLTPLLEATTAMEFAPGVGLAGRVWNDRRAQWSTTFATDRSFPRADAARSCGVTSAFAVPLVSGDEAFLLLSFFSRQPRAEDPATLELLTAIGAQIAEVARRQRAEAAARAANHEVAASRARLKALLDYAPSHVIEVDRDGVVRYVNHTHHYPRERIVGRSWLLTIPEHERPRLAALMREVIEGGTSSSYEVEVELPSGATAMYQAQVGPLRGPRWQSTGDLDATEQGATEQCATGQCATGQCAEEIVGAVIISHDVTETRRLQLELDTGRRLATMGMLAAGVAHEINNPLSSVISNLAHVCTQLARGGDAAVSAREIGEALDDARGGAERIRDIAKDLKTLARPALEANQAVDVRRVFESSLRLASHEVRRRATVVRRFAAVPPVLASEGRLGQVLLNLVINAAQALPEGGADVHEIRVGARVAADGFVCLEVEDTGPGIPDDVRRKLFTPFFTTKGVGVGTGLGLAICDRIVRGFGGRIEVESAPGRGACFRVLVPPAPMVTPPVVAPVLSAATAVGRRVLVIDDEPFIGRSIKRALERHEVRATTNARDALALIEGGERFQVVLCDIVMPVMSAPAFVEELRVHAPDQLERVVLMTAGGLAPPLQSWLDQCGLRLMEKPFSPARLHEIVEAAPTHGP